VESRREVVVPVRPEPSLSALENRILARIGELDAGEVSVSLVDLGTGLRLEVGGDVVMHAASTMKVPVMLEVFRRAEVGLLSLDDRIPVTNRFRSIATDSLYELTVESDSDSTLYPRIGSTATIRELVRLMIVRSSNLALNLLIDRVGAERVRETMAEIGAGEMVVRRGVEDRAAFRAGLNNTTTAHGYANALEAIARCSVTQRTACDEMIEILAAQEFNEMIPAGLPPGTRVAHKTGWITGIRHDGGIIFPVTRAPYVLVILTRGVSEPSRADSIGAQISRLVWEQLTDGSFAAGAHVTEPGARALLELHAGYRVGAIAQRHFGHAQLWRALEPFLSAPIERQQVGRSAEGRSIELLRYGRGPTRVLLWSQMHGDESTATMALADLVHFLHDEPEDARAREWAERLTILMMPMINPDGAERFQRHDLHGVDVNRDARVLSTPEGRTLKAVREQWQPAFGFNLHDQNPRTRVGSTERLAAISVLAPAVDAQATDTPGFLRAKQLAATIQHAIQPLVGGYITRYDDTFNARAFGDLMQQWGTSTVLIESGGWRMDPEKQYLRAVNFVALVLALDAIAADTFPVPVPVYDLLPGNGRAASDILIHGGRLALPTAAPVLLDIAANFEGGSGSPFRALITELGDLAEVVARDTIDVTGLFLHPHSTASVAASGLVPGMEASFVVRTGAAPESEIVFRIEHGIRREAPGGLR
jgi:beta-lactamase class A